MGAAGSMVACGTELWPSSDYSLPVHAAHDETAGTRVSRGVGWYRELLGTESPHRCGLMRSMAHATPSPRSLRVADGSWVSAAQSNRSGGTAREAFDRVVGGGRWAAPVAPTPAARGGGRVRAYLQSGAPALLTESTVLDSGKIAFLEIAMTLCTLDALTATGAVAVVEQHAILVDIAGVIVGFLHSELEGATRRTCADVHI